MKILFVSGSFRKQSFNTRLAEMAMKSLENQAECRLLDYTNVPFFNQDEEIPVHSPVQEARDQFLWADGVWFFTPEYNGMIPGPLKNLLDWMSRSIDSTQAGNTSVLKGRAACVSGAGGRAAAVHARDQLETLLKTCKMRVFDQSVGIGLGWQEFSSDQFADPAGIEKLLADQGQAFIDWINQTRDEAKA